MTLTRAADATGMVPVRPAPAPAAPAVAVPEAHTWVAKANRATPPPPAARSEAPATPFSDALTRMIMHNETTTRKGRGRAVARRPRGTRLPNSTSLFGQLRGPIAAGALGVGVVVAVMFGGSAPDATAVATQHLHEIVTGDPTLGYDDLCAILRDRVSKDAFAAAARRHHLDSATVSVTTTGGTTAAAVKYSIDGKKTELLGDMKLVKDDGTWKVCSLAFPPPHTSAAGRRLR